MAVASAVVEHAGTAHPLQIEGVSIAAAKHDHGARASARVPKTGLEIDLESLGSTPGGFTLTNRRIRKTCALGLTDVKPRGFAIADGRGMLTVGERSPTVEGC